jgi:hypothetical protein
MPLSITARHQYCDDLGKALPLSSSDEEHERCKVAAIEAFEALNPADSWEASLAVQTVLASLHATDCMHEAKRHQDDFTKVARCKAQFASLMREARANRRMLLQEQKLRHGMERMAAGASAMAHVPPAEPPQAEPSSAEVERAAAASQGAQAAEAAPSPQAASTASRPSPTKRHGKRPSDETRMEIENSIARVGILRRMRDRPEPPNATNLNQPRCGRSIFPPRRRSPNCIPARVRQRRPVATRNDGTAWPPRWSRTATPRGGRCPTGWPENRPG